MFCGLFSPSIPLVFHFLQFPSARSLVSPSRPAPCALAKTLPDFREIPPTNVADGRRLHPGGVIPGAVPLYRPGTPDRGGAASRGAGYIRDNLGGLSWVRDFAAGVLQSPPCCSPRLFRGLGLLSRLLRKWRRRHFRAIVVLFLAVIVDRVATSRQTGRRRTKQCRTTVRFPHGAGAQTLDW